MKPEKTTESKVRAIVDGLTYHCTEMATFLQETIADPYFETEHGRRMRKYLVMIMSNHAFAMMELMADKLKEKETGKNKNDIEEMLKDLLDK